MKLGTLVERVAKDYTGGRRGEVVDTKEGRSKIKWTHTKDGKPMHRVTWVKNTDLKRVDNSQIQ